MNDFHSPTAAQQDDQITGTWQLDPQRSSVGFRTPAMWGLIPVTGHFERFGGHLDLSADPAIELVIDASSLQTGNTKRDEHLRSADFFDAEKHPLVEFRSESTRLEGDRLLVRGRLSARGRSIPLDLTVRITRELEALELEARVTAPHRELGMTWNWLGAIRPYSRLLVRARLLAVV